MSDESSSKNKLVFVAGHQPHYLPWIKYFSKIHQTDKFCLVDSIQFRKKYFQHRNIIRAKSGAFWLTVPVKTKGKFDQNICDVEIDNSVPWRRKHWKSIYISYHNAPYFSRYADFFKDVYDKDWKFLADLDEHILKGMLGFFSIKKDIVRSSTFNPQGKKTDLLIDIAREMKADGYLSGTGGALEYVDEEKLKKAGFSHRFQQFTHPNYSQFHGEFIPNLAAIDLLFNHGPESGAIIENTSSRPL
jgi:hypothetical protein